jgi:Bacterial cadherin-like domain
MRSNYLNRTVKTAALAVGILLLGASASFAQSVNLTAGPTTATLPDGRAVPMWGYTCSAAAVAPATCVASNPNAGTGWSPVVITVPTGQGLVINLTNNLTVPTSLVIVGQVGAGLGTTATSTLSPDHTNAQPVTWPIAGTPPGAPPMGVGTPPPQGPRVQSFSTEIAPAGSTPLANQVASGSALTWTGLRPGTYLIESGTHPSIQGPMGLYGILVVTCAPTDTASGCITGTAYPGVNYAAEVPLVLSEIDPVQNAAVAAAVATIGFTETAVWSGQPGGCGNPKNVDGTPNTTTFGTCYPPAVNYDPRYYLVNGVAFDKTGGNGGHSLFPAVPAITTGTILVRFVNAGLRMHVPSIVGAQTGSPAVSGFGLIAEDGNPLPGATRVQSEVFLAAGKTYDVLINAPTATLPVFDRQLSLSANNQRDGGMLAYIGLSSTSTLPAIGVNAAAHDDSYFLVAGNTLTVSDPDKGVMANDVGVYGVQLLGGTACNASSSNTPCVSLNPDGTFVYVPGPTTLGSFTYCANGTIVTTTTPATCSTGLTATVNLNPCDTGSGCLGGAPRAVADNYTSSIASVLQIAPPGVLANDTDPQGHPLTASAPTAVAGGTVRLNPDGSFTAAPASPPVGTAIATVTFQYNAINSQKTSSGNTAAGGSGPATVTVTFQGGSGLNVAVKDAKGGQAITDYRWIIEEDRTFYINPACQVNTTPAPVGCPPAGTVPSLGTNFHTSYMPVVAAGCWGPAGSNVAACEYGQTVVDPSNGSHPGAVCDIGNGVCRTTAQQQTPVNPSQVHLDPTKRYYLSVFAGDAGNSFTAAAGGPVQISAQPIRLTKSGSTVTATLPPGVGSHLAVGDTVVISGATPTGYDGTFKVTSVTPGATSTSTTSFTYTVAGTASFPPSSAVYGTPAPRQFDLARDCPVFAVDYAPGTGTCGHTMGGAPIPAPVAPATTFAPATVLLQPTPLPTASVAVFVFEDDSPLNGEVDVHGGTDTMGTSREPGLGGFEITLFDDAGGTGDATGQMTYDMFNMPLSNSLAGTIDQLTGFDACPISAPNTPANPSDRLVGMIVTCPHFESDGSTVSPLEGQAVIANMMPGRYGVVATPAADRIARGEEWLQTNTLDGQKAHDSFIKVGGPAYFQEFGPAGFHVSVGFANPAIINSRLSAFCPPTGTKCNSSLTGKVTTARPGRVPDERIFSSGTRDSFGFTQCYVSVGDPDDDDFAFTKCAADGTFSFSGLPPGNWRVSVFDQWNDQIVDGLSTPIALANGRTANMEIPTQQWHTNIYTRSFFDLNGDGVSQDNEPGLTLLPTNIRFRDGSYSNFNNTDLNGFAGFNEIFPLFNWYVIEADTTRYKQTGVHVVYDAGGPADGAGGGSSNIAANFANTTGPADAAHGLLPTTLRVPGAVYCGNADCTGFSIANGPGSSATTPSTGRIDPPWVTTEGWQGFSGYNEFIEFGKKPFAAGENGGIHGEVIYASTRPFDDPTLLIHTSWTPDVPGVTINLYQETTAADGTQTLKLVDTTKTTSWDDWAQGFRFDGVPNMNCPGQGDQTVDLFFFTLRNSPQYLNPSTTVPNSSQFKCYDGMHNFNQVQPAPYDGAYQFPSVTYTGRASNGRPTGTNCTVCGTNPTDGTPMLPQGKYVVEMIVPPGYELVKEEDKNILIGDNYIAPVTQQFGGLGSIFIMPDQAEVSSQYNANNAQNPTQNLGSQPRHEGDTGSVETFWPCVGALRIVPDYISLFPYSAEVSPFAGASRHLCDRKEVIIEDQSSVLAKFWVFSSTHVAAHYTGFILDDFSSEFDPFSPQFGEKFAVPNLPVSIKDFSGNEVARVYSDQWGQYNGLNYSTWEVNPPNPTGYAPTMMVACMNDPGNGPTPDPFYNPAYSQFCYEIPYMPGQTQYMDTPVVPTAAFAEGYNPPDCAYPDATPAIGEVDGDGIGPWVSATGHSLTIYTINGKATPVGVAAGDQLVLNNAYSGPSATTPPFSQKFITRHYGFGAPGSVTIGGVSAPVTGWSDTQITVTVPATVPLCNPAGQVSGTGRQQIYHGAEANDRCGELVITSGNGKKSIDTVMVTVSPTTPTRVIGENAANNAIQTALDSATPGALIIVGPGTYNEMLLMWKPVRLQGVGAASVTVNANAHPSGKIDIWRRKVDCLFGLSLNGGFISGANAFDPNGNFVCPAGQQRKVDPIPLEPIVGWDPTLNGNIAELLQEPTLMGAYEGAGITLLAKGVRDIGGQPDPNCTANGVCTPLTNSTADCNAYPSNFLCNPSRVDGMSFIDSSAGGGGIFLHGWNHFTEVSNNRVYANAGTLSGGIVVGQMETADGTIVGAIEQAFNYNTYVQVHNNSVTRNASYGDELNSTTPAAAGGVTICTGADYYRFNFNWVCGNLSSGDAGGLGHFGFSYNGNISNNWILFNQSTNPTLPTHGGGIGILGAAPDGTFCENSTFDVDCAPQLSDGIGPGLVIDSNLILGNTAESGSGGGIRFQAVNGTEVARNATIPANWYGVTVTNNIIVNNVAGWDGGGVSMQDALKVSFINNTVASNDTTASAGVLFNTLGAAHASAPPPGCTPNPDPTQPESPSCFYAIAPTAPQPAGLSSQTNSPNLTASMAPLTPLTCPAGNFPASTPTACKVASFPLLRNDMFWQNRAFNIVVGTGAALNTSVQQNTVTLSPSLSQASTGACPATTNYWDIGFRGDTNSTTHNGSGFTLAPQNSILTSTAGGYAVNGNIQPSSTPVIKQYCNGSRVPPENGGLGWGVDPGISDATLPNPIFSLTAAATVDEGNNWVNLVYGPLSLFGPNNVQLGNYSITTGSQAIDNGSSTGAPNHDFFGTTRPQGGVVDIGAVEFVSGVSGPAASVTGGPLAFGNVTVGTTSAPQTLTLHNTGTATLNGITVTFPPGSPFSRAGGTCGTSLPAGTTSTCTIFVVFHPTAVGTVHQSVAITASNGTVDGSPVGLSGAGQ